MNGEPVSRPNVGVSKLIPSGLIVRSWRPIMCSCGLATYSPSRRVRAPLLAADGNFHKLRSGAEPVIYFCDRQGKRRGGDSARVHGLGELYVQGARSGNIDCVACRRGEADCRDRGCRSCKCPRVVCGQRSARGIRGSGSDGRRVLRAIGEKGERCKRGN